jgi:succinate dehydrogenase/fumarate reductase iron-sulfur protein
VKKIFIIKRQDPEKNDGKPYVQKFEVDLDGGTSVLLAFHHIRQTQDPSLTIRSSCRAGVCGSCSILINGRPRLACKSLLQDFKGEKITLEPLPTYPAVKDLIVDLRQLFADYRKIEPWLKTDQKSEDGKEHLQSIEERDVIEPYVNCITCGVCQGGCPAREKASEEFMGPMLMAKASRWVFDSRDEATIKRLGQIRKPGGTGECDQFSQCTKLCPMEIPASAGILKMRHKKVIPLHTDQKDGAC